MLFLHKGAIIVDPARSAEWNRAPISSKASAIAGAAAAQYRRG
jgi:hypothetical protein